MSLLELLWVVLPSVAVAAVMLLVNERVTRHANRRIFGDTARPPVTVRALTPVATALSMPLPPPPTTGPTPTIEEFEIDLDESTDSLRLALV